MQCLLLIMLYIKNCVWYFWLNQLNMTYIMLYFFLVKCDEKAEVFALNYFQEVLFVP